MPETRRILICGHRAFAARGLAERLAGRHEVDQFSRGPRDRVVEIDANPRLAPHYDTVLNFIVLKYESLAENLAYIEALWRMCRARGVSHLIQISSMSVYRDSVRVFTERSPIKTDPSRCGLYAASKVAAELFLSREAGPTRVSFVRPAYILAPDMPDPLGSTGVRMPSGDLLVLGPGRRPRPVIGRETLHSALARLVERPPDDACEALLAVDPHSPTCLEYLEACCETFGFGRRAVSLPTPLWFGPFLRREIRKGWRKALANLAQRCHNEEYDPAWTEQRLGVSLTADWRAQLRKEAECPI